METRVSQLRTLDEQYNHGEHAARILSQLGFLVEMSAFHGYAYDEQILPVIRTLYQQVEQAGAITKEMAKQAEQALLSLSDVCKEYHITCVAHAHIDMNWMWGYQETATLTIDTFRTMLDLMDEFPEFTFSQSQASVYHIVEKYHPQMLEEIKARIHEGRWEVTATSWVENDSNLSGEESMARHLLYTKRYLSELLEIDSDSLQLNFEPDTFGHNRNVPEILQQAGIKYYYHCRGYDKENIYNWQAPSGARVLVYREPHWYNQTINYDLFYDMPKLCHDHGTKSLMKVYGVGDHGGGPTRRDIQRIRTMAQWPLYPTIEFGTMHGYFQRIEPEREQFATVDSELNYVFTGCYTSQARIKQANHMGEDRLLEAEQLDAQAKVFAQLADSSYQTANPFETSWRSVLFNQFHDILPGSGKRETREHAMGIFQESLAGSMINAKHAMRNVAQNIDTSDILVLPDDNIAEGAGAGYRTEEALAYGMPQTQRGSGIPRIYHLFNPTQYKRTEVVELTLWDWPEDPSGLTATQLDGTPLPLQHLTAGEHYWGHTFQKVAVLATIPPMGYTTCLITHTPKESIDYRWEHMNNPLVDDITDQPLVLENQHLKAIFDSNLELTSLVEKHSGKEIIDTTQKAGSFLLITENPRHGMSSWRVGERAKTVNLNREYPVRILQITRGIRQQIQYTIPYLQSTLTVTIQLDENATTLRYLVHSDWHELGSPEQGIPQLNFTLPLGYATQTYRCGIQFGTIDRPALAQDVPCLDFMAALGSHKAPTAVLISDSKYGFRGTDNSLSVTLVRGSFNPDPYPETGHHHFSLGIGVSDSSPTSLKALAEPFIHPIYSCTNTVHQGSLPAENSLLTVSGSLVVSAVKQAEDGSGLLVRLYNPTDSQQKGTLTFVRPIAEAQQVELLEQLIAPLTAKDRELSVALPKHKIASYRIRF